MEKNDITNLELLFDDLKQRKVISNFVNLKNLYQLKSSQKIVYWGVDCTAKSLHIGHLYQIIQHARLASQGFQIILLLGEATSKIGDPSDKDKERIIIEHKIIQVYRETIEKQLKNIIKSKKIDINFAPLELFYSQNSNLLNSIYKVLKINKEDNLETKWKQYFKLIWRAKEENYLILNNKNWLENLNCINFIDEIGKKVTINYLLAKDWIKKRLSSGLSYAAFSYSLFQAYDFLYLYKNYNCHGQLGGQDQFGNITTGLKIINSCFPDSKVFSLDFHLLLNKKGQKISKSDKNVLYLDSKFNVFYDFFRNMEDNQAIKHIIQLTYLTNEQINELIKLNYPPQNRILQRILLELIWSLNFSLKDLQKIIK